MISTQPIAFIYTLSNRFEFILKAFAILCFVLNWWKAKVSFFLGGQGYRILINEKYDKSEEKEGVVNFFSYYISNIKNRTSFKIMKNNQTCLQTQLRSFHWLVGYACAMCTVSMHYQPIWYYLLHQSSSSYFPLILLIASAKYSDQNFAITIKINCFSTAGMPPCSCQHQVFLF